MSQVQRIIDTLKSFENKPVSAKELAAHLYSRYKEDYSKKELLLKKNGKNILQQISAEIGASKNAFKRASNGNIHWYDEPKKSRVYWYGRSDLFSEKTPLIVGEVINSERTKEDNVVNLGVVRQSLTSDNNLKIETEEDGWDGREESLYPLFNSYLHEHHDIYPFRIDEKTSKNSRGSGGNEWLHPDIVALDPIATKWSGSVKDVANMSHGEIINVWSFEVKKTLSTSNVRKHYFQAVSNSSWANYGYLVATAIESKEAMSELKMLHALHGIGVIMINVCDMELSEILLPAKKRDQVDWDSVNRLASENKDFNEFVNNISDYLKTNRIKRRDWHDIS